MDNQDIINPQNSFDKLATLTLPKGTLTLLPPDKTRSAQCRLQLRRGFPHRRPANRHRHGQPTLLSPSRAYQFVLFKLVKQTQL